MQAEREHYDPAPATQPSAVFGNLLQDDLPGSYAAQMHEAVAAGNWLPGKGVTVAITSGRQNDGRDNRARGHETRHAESSVRGSTAAAAKRADGVTVRVGRLNIAVPGEQTPVELQGRPAMVQVAHVMVT